MLLRPYQRKALGYCKRTDTPALLFEQRVGKTYVTLYDLIVNRDIKAPVLIACPYSAFLSWKYSLLDCYETDFQFIEGSRTDRLKSLLNIKKWNITNHQCYRSVPDVILEIDWSCVILDESLVIKNPKTKITKFYIRLGDGVPVKYILTGTPGLDNQLDYFCQFRFLSTLFLGKNYYSYRRANCNCYGGFKWKLHNQGKQRLARMLQENAYFISRKETGAFKDKTYEIITIEKSKTFLCIEDRLVNHYQLMDQNGTLLTQTVWVVAMIQWYRQLCDGFVKSNLVDTFKFNALYSLLKENKDKKIIIWSCFKATIHTIAAQLGVNYIDGTVPARKRNKIIENFWTEKPYIILNPETARYGMNLSCARLNVFFDLPFSLTTQQQAEDRIVAEGMDNENIFLVRKDSVDEDILAGHRKKENANTLLRSLINKYRRHR